MSLTGRVLLHYRVLEKVGQGGMGTVYKALDTHLDRVVALKVLPPDKIADPERRQRFIQEAKAASALHHPNIVVVHDVTSAQGLDFMVMEYVEGTTLDELAGRRGLKLGEALGYAVQIADGLARAHAAGIIHRDLKPTNIMITGEGLVKVLDFGLAKLTEDAAPSGPEATATLNRPRTEEGYIVGTAAYMSPEQAEGKKVDARSDIFSFGALLYEMLTGRRAFERPSRVATLAAVLREEPKPAGELNEALPGEVEKVVERCLRKDPQRRWQTMSDLKIVLQDLKEDSESGKLSAVRPGMGAARRPGRLWMLAAGVGVVVLTLAAWLVFFHKPAPPPEYEITRLTFDEGLTMAPAFSPDGQMFAYASDRAGGGMDIWVQQTAGGPPLRLTTDPANDWYPCFSPDGSKIVFRSERAGGGIYEVATLGGRERRLSNRGFYPGYSPDGAWISCVDIPASQDDDLKKILLIPSRGGDPVLFHPEFRISDTDTGASSVWSPDGKYLIFNGRRGDDYSSLDWWVAPTAGGPAVRTDAHRRLPLPPVWQAPYAWVGSDIYYAMGSTVEGVNLFRARINPKNWKVDGPGMRITAGAGMQFHASALRDGRVIYVNLSWVPNIWTLEADPERGRVTGPPVPATRDAMAKFGFSLSSDGAKLAYLAFGGFQRTHFEVRLEDFRAGTERVFPMNVVSFDQTPRLSPDGTVLSYRDTIDGRDKTFLVREGDTAGHEACDSCSILQFFPNPDLALVREGNSRLVRLNLASGDRTGVLESRSGTVVEPALSPDGRWVSFVLRKPDGNVAIYIAPLSGRPSSEKDWISVYEDNRYLGSPGWSPEGDILYYLSERDDFCCIWAQRLYPASKAPQGDAWAVYHAHRARSALNFPRGGGSLAVARGKFALWMADVTGNIYLASPKAR
jgi:Tol biopolymer transport system component